MPIARSRAPRFLASLALLCAGLGGSAAAWAEPSVSLVVPAGVTGGSTVIVDVLASEMTDLFAFQFSLGFDPAVLSVASVSEGPFLATGGTTFADGGTVDNSSGALSLVFGSLIGAVPGVNGQGVLAHISFNVAAGGGSSALSFSDLLFLDSNLASLTVRADNGVLQAAVVPEPASLGLLALGFAGVVGWRSRRDAQARQAA